MKLILTKMLVGLCSCSSESALQWSVTPYIQRCGFLSVSLAPVSPGLHFIINGAAMTWFTHSLDEKSPLCWHQQSQIFPNISTCSFVLTCINSPSFNTEMCKLQIANSMFRLKLLYVHSHKHKFFHMTCTCIHRLSLPSECVQSNKQFLSHRVTECVHCWVVASNFHKHEEIFICISFKNILCLVWKGKTLVDRYTTLFVAYLATLLQLRSFYTCRKRWTFLYGTF
jgi:hypothetical protein